MQLLNSSQFFETNYILIYMRAIKSKNVNEVYKYIAYLFLLAAIISSIISSIKVRSSAISGALWIVSLLLTFYSFSIRDRQKIYNICIRLKTSWSEIWGIMSISLYALLVRSLYPLPSTLYIHNDEASCGLYSRILLSNPSQWFSIGWYGLPMLAYSLGAAGLAIFGNTIYGLRYANAILGTIGVVLLYLLTKKLFTRRVAVIAAILLSSMYVHILFSNNGLQDIQGPTFITLSVYLFFVFIDTPSLITSFIFGIALASNLLVYWGARAAFPLIGFLVFYILIAQKSILIKTKPYLKPFVFSFFIAVFPIYSLFSYVPDSFSGHTREVLIVNNTENMQVHLKEQFGNQINYLFIFAKQFFFTVMTFFSTGDKSLQIGYNQPFLDFTMSALLPTSFFLALFLLRKNWKHSVAVLWIALVITASALTTDAPWWPRLASLTPAIAILIAFAIDYISSIYKKRGRYVITILLLSIIIVSNLYTALILYPEFAYKSYASPTVIANYLKKRSDKEYNILLADMYFTFDYETFQFLVPNKKKCNVNPEETVDNCLEAGRPDIVISMPGTEDKLEYIMNSYPGGILSKLKDDTITVYNLTKR